MSKVCIVSPLAYPLLMNEASIKSAGGAEAQLTVIGQGLFERDFNVSFIVDDFGQDVICKKNNLTLYKVPFRYMGGNNLYLIQSWLLLFKQLILIKPDVILIKLPRHLLFPIGLYRKIFNKRLVFIGQIDHDINLNEIKKIEGRLNCFLYKCGIKMVDYVVAQNIKQRDGFRNQFGLNSEIIKSIVTLPEDRNIKKEKYILWVGNSLSKKQPGLFVELAKLLPEYKFVMIMSSAEGGLHDEIKSQSTSVNNLEYLGFVPFSEISQYFKKAHLFVSTSLREGFPNTFLQSWQYGTPVISLNIDPDNVIFDHKLGFISHDIQQMMLDIKVMFSDTNKYIEYSNNTKAYVEKYHEKNAIINAFENVFNQILPE